MPAPELSQEDIAELLVLRYRMRRAQKEYKSKRSEIVHALQAGASVEDGPYSIEATVRCVLQFQ